MLSKVVIYLIHTYIATIVSYLLHTTSMIKVTTIMGLPRKSKHMLIIHLTRYKIIKIRVCINNNKKCNKKVFYIKK